MLLDYFEGKKVLDRYGIRSIESKYVESSEDAVKFAGEEKLVLKLISEKQLHKSKAGLVKLDLSDHESIVKAYKELEAKGRALHPYKIIAQKMAHGGVEIIIGGNEDPQFGKMVLLGLGGIYVEAFKDFALRLCPITRQDALDMIDQLKSRKVVTYDGEATGRIQDLLVRTSKLLYENRDIKELDLNPVVVRPDGYDVVDIRILK